MLSAKTRLPGFIASVFILSILGTSLFSLFFYSIDHVNFNFVDPYLIHIIFITFWQASLSTFFSVFIALIMAKSLSMVNFLGKRMLLTIMPVTFILPSLVVVTGLLSVYGQQGLLSKLFQLVGLPFSFSIYGLLGILLAHVFLNFPYVCVQFYQTLQSVPIEQRQIASQLNFSGLAYFKIVEWPLIRRQILPMSALIFMLCFSSFAIVLALGGGPKYTTLEVAIYQSVRDFDLFQGVILSLLQLVCCMLFMWLTRKISQTPRITSQIGTYNHFLSVPYYLKLACYLVILVCCLFIFTPILSIFIDGIIHVHTAIFTAKFGLVIGYSILLAVSSAIFCLLLSSLILWTNSRLLLYNKINSSHRLMLVATLILAIPGMVLASGLYLICFQYADSRLWVSVIIIICNSLMALPFVLKNLEMPMYDIVSRYTKLTRQLNITGLQHAYLVEYRGLKKLIIMSFAFSAILSMGDFGIIALFGGHGIVTLPYYLYEQLASYRYQDASVTALVLLILSLSILVVVDHDKD